MKLFIRRLAVFTLLLCTLEVHAAPIDHALRHQLIQCINNNKDAESVKLYNSSVQPDGEHDYAIIREMCFAVLERDVKSNDAVTQKLALLGIALSCDEQAVNFFHEAVRSSNPELQLYALMQLCRYHDANVECYLRQAMSSPYVLMRLEAANLLAEGRYSSALPQIESLMQKCPDLLLPIFPEMLAKIGNDGAFQMLRRILMNPYQPARVACILTIAKYKLEKCAPYIRSLATQRDNVQLEACALALGTLKDYQAVPLLIPLVSSNCEEVALASSLALYELGYETYASKIVQLAKSGNLYAVQALGTIHNQQEILLQLIRCGDAQIRINASIGLLRQRDKRACPCMIDILCPLQPQPPLLKGMSPGKCLFAYKPVPLNTYETEDWNVACELALIEKENLLNECKATDQQGFLKLAEQIIERRQNDLIPAVFSLLEDDLSDDCTTLLEKFSQIHGYPLARNYAYVTLIKRGERDPYYCRLQQWLQEEWNSDLLGFRPTVSHMTAFDNDCIQSTLKPNEKAKLFLDTLEALLTEHNATTIAFMIKGLEESHQSLHPIFAALLVRLTQ